MAVSMVAAAAPPSSRLQLHAPQMHGTGAPSPAGRSMEGRPVLDLSQPGRYGPPTAVAASVGWVAAAGNGVQSSEEPEQPRSPLKRLKVGGAGATPGTAAAEGGRGVVRGLAFQDSSVGLGTGLAGSGEKAAAAAEGGRSVVQGLAWQDGSYGLGTRLLAGRGENQAAAAAVVVAPGVAGDRGNLMLSTLLPASGGTHILSLLEDPAASGGAVLKASTAAAAAAAGSPNYRQSQKESNAPSVPVLVPAAPVRAAGPAASAVAGSEGSAGDPEAAALAPAEVEVLAESEEGVALAAAAGAAPAGALAAATAAEGAPAEGGAAAAGGVIAGNLPLKKRWAHRLHHQDRFDGDI